MASSAASLSGRRRSATPRASSRAATPAFDERQLDLRDALSEALFRRVNEDAEREDRRTAEDAWDQGALLNELVALGLDVEEVAARYVGGAALAHERMQLARSTTRLLAAVWGLARVRLGLALLARLKLRRLEQLEDVELPAVAGTVRFPATVSQLEYALAALEN
jgi:hypothetical protein